MAQQRSNSVGSHTVLPQTLLTHYIELVTYALVFEQGFNGYAFIGFLDCRQLFKFEHFILAHKHNRGFETYIANIARERQLKIVIISKPHLDSITTTHRYFGSSVPFYAFGQGDFTGVGKLLCVEGYFYLCNLVKLPTF